MLNLPFYVHSILGAFHDCLSTARHVIDNSERYNIDPARIMISGDSAGGQLALSVGMELHQLGYNIRGIIAVYPMTQIAVRHSSVQSLDSKLGFDRELGCALGGAYRVHQFGLFCTKTLH